MNNSLRNVAALIAGALITFSLAVNFNRSLTLTIGCIFLAGGISASFMIPAPAWFIAADLLLAYLPMAWLAILLSQTPKAL